jgi:hypothetical protein
LKGFIKVFDFNFLQYPALGINLSCGKKVR